MSVLSIKLSFVPVLSWSTTIKTINNTDCIVFRAPVDEYRASEPRARVGTYCTDFEKFRVRCTTQRSSILPEASLGSAMKILGHEFLPERFQFIVRKMLHSTITQFYSHTVQFCNPTVIPCSYTVPQSYFPILKLYHHNL